MDPVSLVHPAAPAAVKPASKTPRYLVRGDGVVLDYNPYLARLPGLTPTDTLPPAHLKQIAAARQRDAALAQALAQLQPVAEVKEAAPAPVPATTAASASGGRLVTVRASELHPSPAALERLKSTARVAVPVPPHAPVEAGPHEAEAIAKARFRAQLKPVFERAGLAMDMRKPMEVLRAEALASLRPRAAPSAARES
jgi:hypothetical protein